MQLSLASAPEISGIKDALTLERPRAPPRSRTVAAVAAAATAAGHSFFLPGVVVTQKEGCGHEKSFGASGWLALEEGEKPGNGVGTATQPGSFSSKMLS